MIRFLMTATIAAIVLGAQTLSQAVQAAPLSVVKPAPDTRSIVLVRRGGGFRGGGFRGGGFRGFRGRGFRGFRELVSEDTGGAAIAGFVLTIRASVAAGAMGAGIKGAGIEDGGGIIGGVAIGVGGGTGDGAIGALV